MIKKTSQTVSYVELDLGDLRISARMDRKERRDRYNDRCTVFAWLYPSDGENVFSQRINASDEAWKLEALRVARAALKELTGFGGRISMNFAVKAGCSCPCSPGFLVQKTLTEWGGDLRDIAGKNVYIDAWHMPTVADAVVRGLQAMSSWPVPEAPADSREDWEDYCVAC